MDHSFPAVPSPRLDQIINATRVLFSRYGYRRTAMDDIAREAGVAKATLYLHFSGKEDVFRAMLARCRELLTRRCDEAEALDAPAAERLAALLDAHFGTALDWFGDANHIGELRPLVSPQGLEQPTESETAFQRRLTAFLARAATAGELAPERAGLTPESLAELIINAATGAKYVRGQTSEGHRAAMRSVVALIVAGLAPAAGSASVARRA